jgi:hypothetical protein
MAKRRRWKEHLELGRPGWELIRRNNRGTIPSEWKGREMRRRMSEEDGGMFLGKSMTK